MHCIALNEHLHFLIDGIVYDIKVSSVVLPKIHFSKCLHLLSGSFVTWTLDTDH